EHLAVERACNLLAVATDKMHLEIAQGRDQTVKACLGCLQRKLGYDTLRQRSTDLTRFHYLVEEWNLLLEFDKRVDRLAKRELVLPTDAQSFEQDDGVLDALGSHLHLLADPELVADLLPRRLRDEDLAAGGAGLDTRREVHVASYYAVFHAFGRADIAQHHLAGVDADAHLDLR